MLLRRLDRLILEDDIELAVGGQLCRIDLAETGIIKQARRRKRFEVPRARRVKPVVVAAIPSAVSLRKPARDGAGPNEPAPTG